MPSELYQIAYVSSAKSPFSAAQLGDILGQSRRNNAQRGITGMMIYVDGNIFQVLEGPNDVVRIVFDTIRVDSRHHDVITLIDKSIDERTFPEWHMGFSRRPESLSSDSTLDLSKDLARFVDLTRKPSTTNRILRSFVANNIDSAILDFDKIPA